MSFSDPGQPLEIISVSKDESLERIDKILASRYPAYSRTYFQYLIENHSVLLNGEIVKKRTKPQEGDEIEVCFLLLPELSLQPENIPLDLLYEDEDLIAINKPAGMVVHPAPGHPSGTFVNALLFHCKEMTSTLDLAESKLRPGIVHRLDKETSGVLLAAKNQQCHSRLVEAFSKRTIKKHYLALCLGNPGDRTIDAPIGRHPQRRKEMAVVPETGKEALTECKVLASSQMVSLVSLSPHSGRTHQLRVHLKHLGTPVLGDTIYGNPQMNQKYRAERQMLHAQSIRFCHPISGKELTIIAPLPPDFLHWKDRFPILSQYSF